MLSNIFFLFIHQQIESQSLCMMGYLQMCHVKGRGMANVYLEAVGVLTRDCRKARMPLKNLLVFTVLLQEQVNFSLHFYFNLTISQCITGLMQQMSKPITKAGYKQAEIEYGSELRGRVCCSTSRSMTGTMRNDPSWRIKTNCSCGFHKAHCLQVNVKYIIILIVLSPKWCICILISWGGGVAHSKKGWEKEECNSIQWASNSSSRLNFQQNV